MDNRMLQAAGIAGVVMGALSGIPFIQLCNCFFCTWAWVGGALAAMLYSRSSGVVMTTGGGAKVGALAGVIGAVVYSVIGSLVGLVTGSGSGEFAQALQLLRSQGQGEMAQRLAELPVQTGGGFSIGGLCFTLVIGLIFLTAFGALGGLIGASLFGKKPSAPPAM
jgi:hypothetical protein